MLSLNKGLGTKAVSQKNKVGNKAIENKVDDKTGAKG